MCDVAMAFRYREKGREGERASAEEREGGRESERETARGKQ